MDERYEQLRELNPHLSDAELCAVLGIPAGQGAPKASGKRVQTGGRREDLGIYVRSAWEANWARYLNWLAEQGEIARWEYEPDEFAFPVKRGTRFYTPDFKVYSPAGGYEYHEVKGWMDSKSKTALRRMTKYHPDVRVTVIDAEVYYSVKAQVASLIRFWED